MQPCNRIYYSTFR